MKVCNMAALAGLCLALAMGQPGASGAQPFGDDVPLTALARPVAAQSEIVDFGAVLQITLALSQPVPWRVFTLDAPPRLILDFNEVDFTGAALEERVASDRIAALRYGAFAEGWSRMVIALAEPMIVETAGLTAAGPSGRAIMKLQLAPTDARRFAELAGPPPGSDLSRPRAVEMPKARARRTGERPLRVVLDPGHGGIDPGAEVDALDEADLMLTFALELAQVLRAAGMEVSLTREEDVFVPLEARVSFARKVEADAFLSLHADALAEGNASGASVYTLSAAATDEASARLAERHDRADLLSGVDLTYHDDAVATVLMDLARLETEPRSDRLADALVAGIAAQTGDMHKRPRLRAGFSVLKAPDIPSALIELGFLSSRSDLERLTSPAWRGRAAAGIRDALLAWGEEDAREGELLRR
ncbi:putative N-acetylmuramoyl-L-alanine amidase [Profundibacterium mesophilum KAUST100406-0324]|uniref:N-acetylmuramoyl-L-alanine amidase n=2 Tax=Profundibacterium TaxID=1258570 RepID=A0A921NRA7_9RHOB|nr:putative N-acetylmuramoyl-L-alanine amidase [Profundibacterium mesophilum KAUST100406-0324]